MLKKKKHKIIYKNIYENKTKFIIDKFVMK